MLPPEFGDLEEYAPTWCLATEAQRYARRLSSTMTEMQAFYDAAFPRIDDAMAYLEQYEPDALPEDGKRLLWLYCALVTVSFPVEVWRQPRVPDSGSTALNAILEPAV